MVYRLKVGRPCEKKQMHISYGDERLLLKADVPSADLPAEVTENCLEIKSS